MMQSNENAYYTMQKKNIETFDNVTSVSFCVKVSRKNNNHHHNKENGINESNKTFIFVSFLVYKTFYCIAIFEVES